MRESSAPHTIRRHDYRPPAFLIDQAQLDFQLDAHRTEVTARLQIRRNPKSDDRTDTLVLDGQDLEHLDVQIDGESLHGGQFTVGENSLSIRHVPDAFELLTRVRIHPDQNTALEGLYQSGPFLLTQCEAEGFRKITWYLDRPDVMATFEVRLEADRDVFPVLLSNGNLVESGELEGGRHFTRWHDPHPKPSYLFALVGGQLAHVEASHITPSGKDITLRIYTEQENIDQVDYAMGALKRAIDWDEMRFGLSYDLDLFNIVVTNDFNMGAMENKSLNIFNSKYVLAHPDTATDSDFLAVEAVIGHEYFHNWTGNRITCRDWFQLSLKEGLTVFRDQEFTADLNSRAVKRIEDVRMLRSAQFDEDAGPMAHPVRPDSYIEINNFYTLTVYEKGAEVVRMYHTLLGEEGFMRGMAEYVRRHDGQAVTCDDFRLAMAEANAIDLSQFERWYSQAGTPRVDVVSRYDAASQRFALSLRQHTPPTPDQVDKDAQLIPIRLGLLDSEGRDMPLHPVDFDLVGEGDTLLLREDERTFVFEDVPEAPLPSLLRGFSAPVILDYPYTRAQLAQLMAKDSDPFNRWDAGQRLALMVISEQCDAKTKVAPELLGACAALVADEDSDPALIAEALRLPDEATLAQHRDVMDVEAIVTARKRVRQAIAAHCEDAMLARYRALQDKAWSIDGAAMARRALKNVLLSYLCALEDRHHTLAESQYANADNMTDRLAALIALVHEHAACADSVLEDFHTRYQRYPLVMDKWLAVQASAPGEATLDRVESLLDHPLFSLRNPNKVRALIGTLSRNMAQFHSPRGYRFVAERVAELDALNPQIAARLVSAFNTWRRLPEPSRGQARLELERLAASGKLSNDVYEIVSKALAQG